MKKIVLSIVLALFTINVFAGKPIKVVAGDMKVLKESAEAILEFDYSETRWEKRENYKEKSGEEYENRVNFAFNAFKESFNNSSKGLKITDDSETKYKIVFKVENLEQHQGGGMWGRLYMTVFGKIDIINLSNQSVVCSFSISKLDGGADYTMPGKIEKAFSKVAVVLNSLVK